MKPILFNTEMVRALLAGTKTVTRRVIRKQPRGKLRKGSGPYVFFWDSDIRHPPCVPGDILWVRETWSTRVSNECFAQPCHLGVCPYESCESPEKSCFPDEYIYKATDSLPDYGGKWRPSIHMPKKAARIFLRVKSVRIERLQEITNEGAKAEGVSPIGEPRRQFAVLWETTIKEEAHTAYGWAANPWVWVIEFERCEKPKEDAGK